ncbi:MAG: hypothetical protein KDB14_29475, partial [Planctomycetales bacterium]|nr:hypothetical protein [Planctomycetales bacterium]
MIPDPASQPQPPAHLFYGADPMAAIADVDGQADANWVNQTAGQRSTLAAYNASLDQPLQDDLAQAEDDKQGALYDLAGDFNEARESSWSLFEDAKKAAANVANQLIAAARSLWEAAQNAVNPQDTEETIAARHTKRVKIAEDIYDEKIQNNEATANTQLKLAQLAHHTLVNVELAAYQAAMAAAEEVWVNDPDPDNNYVALATEEGNLKHDATRAHYTAMAALTKQFDDTRADIAKQKAQADAQALYDKRLAINSSQKTHDEELAAIGKWKADQRSAALENLLKTQAEAREQYRVSVAGAQKLREQAIAEAKRDFEVGSANASRARDESAANHRTTSAQSYHSFMQTVDSAVAADQAENEGSFLAQLGTHWIGMITDKVGAALTRVISDLTSIVTEVTTGAGAERLANETEATQQKTLLDTASQEKLNYQLGEIAAWRELQDNVAKAHFDYTKNVADDQNDWEHAKATSLHDRGVGRAEILSDEFLYPDWLVHEPLVALHPIDLTYDVLDNANKQTFKTAERTEELARETLINKAVLHYYVGASGTYVWLAGSVGNASGVNELKQVWDNHLIDGVELFNVNVASAEESLLVSLANAAATRVGEMASSLMTWLGLDLAEDAEYTSHKGQLTTDRLVGDATDEADEKAADHQARSTGMSAWNDEQNTPWSQMQTAIFDAGGDFVASKGAALTGLAQAFGDAFAMLGNNQVAADNALATGQASALTTQDTQDAGDQADYVASLMTSEGVYVVNTEDATKVRDKAIVAAERKDADSRAQHRYDHKLAVDTAYFNHGNAVGVATKAADDLIAEFWKDYKIAADWATYNDNEQQMNDAVAARDAGVASANATLQAAKDVAEDARDQ